MYPRMLEEIIESIEFYFADDKEIVVDCLLYLLSINNSTRDICRLKEWFKDNNRCYKCGEPLEWTTFKEPHPECGPGVYETFSESYCKNCDV